ncbi:MAG: hypothetical protein AMJ81_14680 [Phycisphaerae bacterium SM23_33]|jgi:hypothetical protein|nr:MAG: hypothetical protein AMJ81_14680 [Phycisphaerae bacterium SM23_33]
MPPWDAAVTNETYLVVSYFSSASIGALIALVTASELARPARQALAGLAGPLARMFRRALPVWLVLAVLLAFLSVTYFDCAHTTYEQIVADRDHLAATARRQGSHMAWYLAVGLLAYGLVLAGALLVKARQARPHGDRQDSSR